MYVKAKRTLLAAVILLGCILAGCILGIILFSTNHFILDGHSYPKNALLLDLHGKNISLKTYLSLKEELPDCTIIWDVPFQGGSVSNESTAVTLQTFSDSELSLLQYLPELQQIDATSCTEGTQLRKLVSAYPNATILYNVTIDAEKYPQDAQSISISEITAEDMVSISLLPALKTIHAERCTDYQQLKALQLQYPWISVRYSIPLLGADYPSDTTKIELASPNLSDLLNDLDYFPSLTNVHFTEPEGTSSQLLTLLSSYPDIEFSWEKTILGTVYSSEKTEFDFSGMDVSTADIEQAMAYFPNAQKVILSDCGIENETLEAFRNKVRDHYKVVWTVNVGGIRVRTDETVFHSSIHGVAMVDEECHNLYYCEDMIVVDIGHSHVKHIEWVRGMPNLQYLIIADNWIKDISPISTCKNLVYLELFINKYLKDYSPLLGCTSLKDVNIAFTFGDVTPLAQMTWLNNLWVNSCELSRADIELLLTSLPNTRIEYSAGFSTANGWRQVENYYKMRDIMGLPYNVW